MSAPLHRTNRIIGTFLFALLFAVNGFAQEIPQAALDTLPWFTSIEEAMKNPEEVYKLTLRKNKLNEIPGEVFGLANLRILILSKNKIKELPLEIGNLVYLEELDLTGNKLEQLPAEIGQLKKLKRLRCGMNELEFLPDELGDMEQLELLDIWSNNIVDLPLTILDLQNLKTIDMRVIQLNTQEKAAIESILPEGVKIRFSNSCDCD